MSVRGRGPAARADLRRLLLWSVSDDLRAVPSTPPTPDPLAHPAELLRACSIQGVSLQANAALADVPGASAVFQAEVTAQISLQLRGFAQLSHIATALADVCPWLVIKGPVLADHVYRLPARRSYSDIDVVVPAPQAAAALDAVTRRGAVLLSRNWEWLTAQGKHEVQLSLAGIELDLHWHVLGSPGRIPALRLDMDRLFARARTVRIGEAAGRPMDVLTLDPTDQLIHLSIHAVRSGMGPLRLVLDIDQAWRHDPPVREDLLDRCHESGAGLFVAVALQRAAGSLGTPVPPDLTAALAGAPGRGWLRTMRLLDEARPPERAHEGLALTGLRAATRTDTASSTAAATEFMRGRLSSLAHPTTAIPKIRRRLRGDLPDHTADLELQGRDVDGGRREALFRSLSES